MAERTGHLSAPEATRAKPPPAKSAPLHSRRGAGRPSVVGSLARGELRSGSRYPTSPRDRRAAARPRVTSAPRPVVRRVRRPRGGRRRAGHRAVTARPRSPRRARRSGPVPGHSDARTRPRARRPRLRRGRARDRRRCSAAGRRHVRPGRRRQAEAPPQCAVGSHGGRTPGPGRLGGASRRCRVPLGTVQVRTVRGTAWGSGASAVVGDPSTDHIRARCRRPACSGEEG